MRSLRTLLVILFTLRTCHLVSGFKPSVPPPKDAQVLVIGASGRVGGEVVNRLSKQGYKVRAMIREPNTFFPLKKDLGTGPVEIVLGNVLDRASLDEALEGCSSCIDCHGSGRPIALSDLWTHPSKDPEKRHPYHVNYLGVKNLVEAALATGCPRVVRVTGLSVGLSELHPLAFLLNFCLSMAIMWQWEAEKVLREATERGLDYTIVRPGGLTDLPRPKNSCLVLGSDGKPPSMFEAMPFYRINRRDVADLLVAAMAGENTRRATLSCAWGRDPKGPKSWKKLLAKVKPDMSPLPLRHYRQATAFLGTVMTAAIMGVILKISYIRYSILTRKKQKGFLV